MQFYADQVSLKQALRSGERYYVYILCRPDRTPFYVGKGVGDRVLHHEAEARNTNRLTHKLNVIRFLHRTGLSVHYCIDSYHSEEAHAHARERYLIDSLGRHDLKRGPLTNQTDGGEGTSNPSEESRERRRESLWGDGAEDPDRQIANRFFQRLMSVQSVTLKPTSTWKIASALRRNRAKFPMTDRQAATLAATAISNRVMLNPDALLPRRLVVENSELIIENGVGCDMLSSEMITIADSKPTYEILRLTEPGFRFIIDTIPVALLADAGVLSPEHLHDD